MKLQSKNYEISKQTKITKKDLHLLTGVRTFRPMPFQQLQFQPITLSTSCHFNGVQSQPRAISTAANSAASII